MILKNTSNTTTVVLNTNVGIVQINPGEIVDIKHKIYPPIFDCIVSASEEEYLAYKRGKLNPLDKPSDDIDSAIDENDQKTFKDEVLTNTQKTPEIEKTTTESTEKSKALKVKETQTDDEITVVQNKISDLEKTWLTETNPKQKEQISKEIKKIKKQLEKLQKVK